VKERRTALRLTQDALCARLADVTLGFTDFQWVADEQEIQKIEYGTRTVTTLELIALSQALECSASWLLVEKETEPLTPLNV
jgi:transcriptional regulator with XRE-family HTH domain